MSVDRQGRRDPRRTHNPSAVGLSPPAPPVQVFGLRKRLFWVSERQLRLDGLDPLLVGLGPGWSACVPGFDVAIAWICDLASIASDDHRRRPGGLTLSCSASRSWWGRWSGGMPAGSVQLIGLWAVGS